MNANYRQLSFIQLINLNLLFKDDLPKTLKDISGDNRVGNDFSRKLNLSFHTPRSSKQSLTGNNFCSNAQDQKGKTDRLISINHIKGNENYHSNIGLLPSRGKWLHQK